MGCQQGFWACAEGLGLAWTLARQAAALPLTVGAAHGPLQCNAEGDDRSGHVARHLSVASHAGARTLHDGGCAAGHADLGACARGPPEAAPKAAPKVHLAVSARRECEVGAARTEASGVGGARPNGIEVVDAAKAAFLLSTPKELLTQPPRPEVTGMADGGDAAAVTEAALPDDGNKASQECNKSDEETHEVAAGVSFDSCVEMGIAEEASLEPVPVAVVAANAAGGFCARQADGPGMYIVTRKVGLSASMVDNCSKFHAELKPGHKLEVLEILHMEPEGRIRARIRSPAGWISLVNLETGHRWAEREGCVALLQAQRETAPAGCKGIGATAPFMGCRSKEAVGRSLAGTQPGNPWPASMAGSPVAHGEQTAEAAADVDTQVSHSLDTFFNDARWLAVQQVADSHELSPTLPAPSQGCRYFRVQVPRPYPGVFFRSSKAMLDKHSQFAKQGEVVYGRLEDNGTWLHIVGRESLFLPMRLGDTDILVPVLRRSQELNADAAAARGAFCARSCQEKSGNWWLCSRGAAGSTAAREMEITAPTQPIPPPVQNRELMGLPIDGPFGQIKKIDQPPGDDEIPRFRRRRTSHGSDDDMDNISNQYCGAF